MTKLVVLGSGSVERAASTVVFTTDVDDLAMRCGTSSRAVASAKPTSSEAGANERISKPCNGSARWSPRKREVRSRKASSRSSAIDRATTCATPIDPTRVETELGWKPRETFESGLRKTVRRYIDNAEWVGGVRTGACRAWIAKNYEQRT